MQKTVTFNNSGNSAPSWNNHQSQTSQNKISLPIVLLVATLILIAFGAVAFALKINQDLNNIKTDLTGQQTQLQEEAKKYLDELKKILLIDSEESPVIAKVADPEKLKTSNPEFYKNIQKGDIVYIFSYRIIVYRESENKIINIAPIVNTQKVAATSNSTTK